MSLGKKGIVEEMGERGSRKAWKPMEAALEGSPLTASRCLLQDDVRPQGEGLKAQQNTCLDAIAGGKNEPRQRKNVTR